MQRVRTAALETPFSVYTTGADKSVLEALEKMLTEGDVVREKDVYTYLAQSLEAYKTGYEMPPDAIARLISLTNQYEFKTLGLSGLLWNIISVNVRNLYVSKNAPALLTNTFEPKFLFLFQSGYYSLYLGNNSSVMGSSAEPLTRTGTETAGTVLYSELPKEGLTKASVLADMRFFLSTMSDAIQALQFTQP
jgi:hypothetical protein